MRTIPALLVTNPFLAVLAIGCGANDHTLGFLPGSPDGGPPFDSGPGSSGGKRRRDGVTE
jgi:hypothetical protein